MKSVKSSEYKNLNITVVIPAYKVVNHILDVLRQIGPEVNAIYVVDDNCPEGTGNFVEKNCRDKRVKILKNEINLGVGGAVKSGYTQALANGANIIVKIDGDGQMDARRIPELISPIANGFADYSKGNRFNNIEDVKKMPKIRIFGNLTLSFFSKFSTGYWSMFDPNNGFTAINAETLRKIPLQKISNRYFFESDMLFRLNIARSTVSDISMPAIYSTEKSNLSIGKTLLDFPIKHLRNFLKRIFYTYYLRDFSTLSLELPLGFFLLFYSMISSIFAWRTAEISGLPTPSGTLMLITISLITSIQLLLNCLNYDIQNSEKLYYANRAS